jgi:hypothetical protein
MKEEKVKSKKAEKIRDEYLIPDSLFELNINRSIVQKVEEEMLNTSPLPEKLFDEIKTSIEFVMGDTLMRFSYGRDYQDYLLKQRTGSLPTTTSEKKSNNFFSSIRRGSVTDAVGEFFTGKRKGGSPSPLGMKVMLTEDQIKKKIQKQRIMEEDKFSPASPDTPKRNSIWTFGKNSKKDGPPTDRKNSIVELFAGPLSNRKKETPTTPDVTKTSSLLSSRSEKKKEALINAKNLKLSHSTSETTIDEVTPIQFESNPSWKNDYSPKVENLTSLVSSHENSDAEEETKKVQKVARKSTMRKTRERQTRERPVYGDFNTEFKMEVTQEIPLSDFKMEQETISEFKMEDTKLSEFKMEQEEPLSKFKMEDTPEMDEVEETPETLLEFKMEQSQDPSCEISKEKRKTNRKPREETSTSFDSFSFGGETKEEEKIPPPRESRSSSRRTKEKPVYGEFKVEEEFKISEEMPETEVLNFPNEKRKTNRKPRESPIISDSFSLDESSTKQEEEKQIPFKKGILNISIPEVKTKEERRNEVLSPRKPREYLNSNFSFENLEKEMKEPNSNLDLLLKKRKSKNEQVGLSQPKRKGRQEMKNSFSDEKETVNQ